MFQHKYNLLFIVTIFCCLLVSCSHKFSNASQNSTQHASDERVKEYSDYLSARYRVAFSETPINTAALKESDVYNPLMHLDYQTPVEVHLHPVVYDLHKPEQPFTLDIAALEICISQQCQQHPWQKSFNIPTSSDNYGDESFIFHNLAGQITSLALILQNGNRIAIEHQGQSLYPARAITSSLLLTIHVAGQNITPRLTKVAYHLGNNDAAAAGHTFTTSYILPKHVATLRLADAMALEISDPNTDMPQGISLYHFAEAARFNISDSYTFELEGEEITGDIKLTIPFRRNSLPVNVEVADLYVKLEQYNHYHQSTTTTKIQPISIDHEGHTLTIQLQRLKNGSNWQISTDKPIEYRSPTLPHSQLHRSSGSRNTLLIPTPPQISPRAYQS